MRNIRMTTAVPPSMAKRVTVSVATGSLGVIVAAAVSSLSPATASPGDGPPKAAAASHDPWPDTHQPGAGAWPKVRKALHRHRGVRAVMAGRTRTPTPSPSVTATSTVTASPSPTATASPSASASASASASSSAGGINVSVDATPSGSASPTPTAFPIPHRPRLKTFVVPPCEPGVFFSIHFQKPVDMFVPNSYYVDGPGGDMQVWIRRVHLVRLHVELEKEVDTDFNIQNFIAKIRKNLRPEVEEEHVVESGHQYTTHVSKDMIGHIRYRVFGLRVGFDQWRIFHNCGRLRINSGVATFPTIREGWKFWETRGWPKTTAKAPKGGAQARGVRPARAITGRKPAVEHQGPGALPTTKKYPSATAGTRR
ncbi:hypothetical protein GCM10023196_034220 [Actinoallomurus vinaceus]|uniref:Uncharacterized protein n=1 Tax=Actinoallomurus vinaceus TaxID=1080074 RepID=A0ABP8UC63_9ACTN